MGYSTDYPNVPDWAAKPEGYQTGAVVKYKGNLFRASFWASEPGVGNADENGWRFFDELYDQTPHVPTEQAKIIAYIPTWRGREGFYYANSEMYRNITHGIIAFLTFSEDSLGEFDPKSVTDVLTVLPDVVTTGHAYGTSIMVALGGAEDYGFLGLMTAIGNDPASPLLDRAVQNVVNFVTSNSLDGVDLDLECWWDRDDDPSKDQGGRTTSQGPHPAGYALTLFAQRLRQAMPGKLVSAAVFGTSWYGNNYDPGIADHVDWLGLMTYDLTGSWNESPVGPHTALAKIRSQETSGIRAQEPYQEAYAQEQQGEWPNGMEDNPVLSVEDSLWYWTNPLYVNWQGSGQKLPRSKVAVGVPLYGYDFAASKSPDPDDPSRPVPPGYAVLPYSLIQANYPEAHDAPNANIKVPGNSPRPPFVSAPGDYPCQNNIYFENPRTALAKLAFVRSIGAQGVICWEISNDVWWEEGKSIIKTLYSHSGNPERKWSTALPVTSGTAFTNNQTGQTIGIATTTDIPAVKGRQPAVETITVVNELRPPAGEPPRTSPVAELKYYTQAGFGYLDLIDVRDQRGALGSGLGNYLMNRMSEHLRLGNINTVRLNSPAPDALDFYRRLGFQQIGANWEAQTNRVSTLSATRMTNFLDNWNPGNSPPAGGRGPRGGAHGGGGSSGARRGRGGGGRPS